MQKTPFIIISHEFLQWEWMKKLNIKDLVLDKIPNVLGNRTFWAILQGVKCWWCWREGFGEGKII